MAFFLSGGWYSIVFVHTPTAAVYPAVKCVFGDVFRKRNFVAAYGAFPTHDRSPASKDILPTQC